MTDEQERVEAETKRMQAHYRAQHEAVKKTRTDDRKRIAERDAKGTKR
jgi:hypothetical protein